MPRVMLRVSLLTVLALLAFAGNSVLCRLALAENQIDPVSFTSIRLFFGALFLIFLVMLKTRKTIDTGKGSWLSSSFLFVYAIAFSYSYISLETGTGALILFGTVQVTMIVFGLVKGSRLHLIEWIGLLCAFLGLCVLLLPGGATPSFSGFALMVASGIAWGCYTLAGRGSKEPLLDTANNFLKTLPFIVVVTLLTFDGVQLSSAGITLAIMSGVITSGLGYAIWYSVLPALTVTKAAVVQLTVPIIAAFGGVFFSSENVSVQLMISSTLVLGGVLVVIVGKHYVE